MKKEPKCTGENKNHLYRDRMTETDGGNVCKINEICAFCGVVKVIEEGGEDGTVMESYFRTSYDPKTDDEFTHERQNCREGGSVHLWDPDWEYFCVQKEGPISKVIDKNCERCDVVRRECVFRNGKGSSVTYSRRTAQDRGIEA